MNKCKNGCIIGGKDAREFWQSWMLLIEAGLGRIVDWWDDCFAHQSMPVQN